jgi:hypothetical protein
MLLLLKLTSLEDSALGKRARVGGVRERAGKTCSCAASRAPSRKTTDKTTAASVPNNAASASRVLFAIISNPLPCTAVERSASCSKKDSRAL